LRKQLDMSTNAPPLWQSGYSAGTLASSAMFCWARYQQITNAFYRELILRYADRYADSRPEEDVDAWPMSFGHAISTQVAAYKLSRQRKYLAQGERLARTAVEIFWQDSPLPRASMQTGHYETITGADSLALALLELHAATHGLTNRIPANTIDR